MYPYSDEWRQLRKRLLERSNQRCQKCGAMRGFPHPYSGKIVTLLMVHLDGNKDNFKESNLSMVCVLCKR